jgi:REG-2-like HAD superfamily hydrolase
MPIGTTPRRTILIALDAFGTVFSPRAPVAVQYVDVVRAYGITHVDSDQLAPAFKEVFKNQWHEFPNYGKRTGMQPETWWASVITDTFNPLMSTADQAKLPAAIPALLTRFSSSSGYMLHEDAARLIRHLRETRTRHDAKSQPIVGVLSNSDPRVPTILQSFGLTVAPLSANSDPQLAKDTGGYDLQFTVLSYDADIAKPDPAIFTFTDSLVSRAILEKQAIDSQDIVKIYIGDEMDKDAIPANRAGWHAVIVDRDAPMDSPVTPSFHTSENGMTIETVRSLMPWNPRVLCNP